MRPKQFPIEQFGGVQVDRHNVHTIERHRVNVNERVRQQYFQMEVLFLWPVDEYLGL